jgi:RHS repeat-associated protein
MNILRGKRSRSKWRLLFATVSILSISLVPLFSKVASASSPTYTNFPMPSNKEWLEDMAYGPDGNLWFTDDGTSSIGKMTPSGSVTEFSLPNNESFPDGTITSGPDGNLWFGYSTPSSSAYNTGINRVTTAGHFTEFPINGYELDDGPVDGPDDSLWFSAESNSTGTYYIGQITTSGAITYYPLANNAYPAYLTSGSDGNLWFIDGSSNSIGKMTPSGSVTEFSLPNNGAYIVGPITSGPDGNLWFASSLPNGVENIGKITTEGKITEYTISSLGNAAVMGVGPIVAGPNGNLWFNYYELSSTVPSDNHIGIGQITTSGASTFYASSLSSSQYIPLSLVSGPGGSLWFIEFFSNGNPGSSSSIVRVNLSGVSSPSSNAPPTAQQVQTSNRTSSSSINTASNGEPINMIGGNYLASRQEFNVPSRDLPVDLSLSYNSDASSQNSPVGYGWTDSYNTSVISESDGSIVVTNPDGRMDQYIPNGSGGYDPPSGIYDSLTKTSSGWQVANTDHDIYNFNTSGQLTNITSPKGNTQTLSYNSQNELATLTDTVGRVFTFSYNSNGNLIKVTDPSGRTVQYTYDSNGNLATATDPNGGITTYSYDTDHHITSITDPNGNVAVTNTYNSNGQVLTQKNALGAEITLAYAPGQTTFTDAKGNKTTYYYDSDLRLTKVVNASGGVTSYTYDSNSDQSSITDPDGNTTSFVYDADGNLIQETDASGGVTKYTYNTNHNLLSETDPLGHATGYTYDSKDNVTQMTDPAGGKTTYGYDSHGDLTSTTDPTGATTKLGYDNQGNVTTVTDPLGNVSHISYDSIGRPIASTDATGQTTTYVYDALDQLLQTKDPRGDAASYTYDANGNQIKATDPDDHSTTYMYNAANELTQVIDALGHKTNYTYDADGNIASSTDADGHKTTYSYDVLDQLVGSVNPLGQKTTQTYGTDGNVISSTDPKGQTTKYTYNPLGQLTDTTYANHTSVTYAYDADGDQTQMTDSTGKSTYSYDVLGNLVKVTSPGNKTVSYAYNPDSQQTAMTYPNGQTDAYAYDAAGELTTAKTGSNQTTSYAYDPNGNVTDVNYPNGAGITYAYDNAEQLTNVTDMPKNGRGESYTYALDADGNRTGVNESSISSTVTPRYKNSWLGSTLGRVEFRYLDGGYVDDGHYDTPVSSQKTQYSYDALNRLVGVQSKGTNQSFTYDPAGNRLTQTDNYQTTDYTYDAGDELLSAGHTTYAYNADGNRTQQKDGGQVTNYSYNDANELTSVSNRYHTLDQYTYNGDGDRVQTTSGRTTIGDVWNINGSLPQLLSQTTNGRSTDYQYGLSLISSGSSNPSQQSYYEYDGLGSVVGTTNSMGATTSQDTYGVYGNTDNDTSGGGDNNQSSFGFAGQQQDSTGLDYMRARYYDPSTGTFLSRDSHPASPDSPQTINRYSYVTNDPVNLVDPSGQWAYAACSSASAAAVAGVGASGNVELCDWSGSFTAITVSFTGSLGVGLEAGFSGGISDQFSSASSPDGLAGLSCGADGTVNALAGVSVGIGGGCGKLPNSVEFGASLGAEAGAEGSLGVTETCVLGSSTGFSDCDLGSSNSSSSSSNSTCDPTTLESSNPALQGSSSLSLQ